MGESRPSPATAPDCQSLTEQLRKDLQTMGTWPLVTGQYPGCA
jgi:hypothetical protein